MENTRSPYESKFIAFGKEWHLVFPVSLEDLKKAHDQLSNVLCDDTMKSPL